MGIDQIGVGGVVHVVHRRNGVEVGRFTRPNKVTDVGLNMLLDSAFGSAVPAGAWSLGLRGNGVSTPAQTWADKGWSEITAYAGPRPTWVHGSAVGGVMTSTAAVNFAFSAPVIVRGVFLSDAAAKNSAGRLFMVSDFGAAVIMGPADVLEVTYALTVARRA